LAGKNVNLSEFAKEIGAFTDTQIEKLKEATVSGIVRSIPDLVAASPVDTGQYASSWNFTKTEQGAIIGNTAPHAPIIEHGARPFKPPIAPLLAWAHRVLRGTGAQRGQPLTQKQASAEGKSGLSGYSDDEWRLARGVQKKIERFGMAPRHILEKAIPGILENIKAEYERG
jgi:hypothetical protein